MTASPRTRHRRLAHALFSSPLASPPMTAAAQTRLTWARRLEALDEVPQRYRTFFASHAPFPLVLLTPSYAGFLSRTTEKLLCFDDPWLHILENVGGRYAATTFHVDALCCLEAGTLLLQSWLTFTGPTADGSMASRTLKFNTVGDFLFAPVVERIRGGARVAPETAAAERSRFDSLAQDHFKFMNAAKRSLLPGEHVLAWVMQPALRAEVVRLIGRPLHRMVAPAHILILTDCELILVAEEARGAWSREPTYGSIRTTVPLAQIAGVELHEADERLQLVVHLPGEMRIVSLFARSTGDAVDNLLARLQEARAALGP